MRTGRPQFHATLASRRDSSISISSAVAACLIRWPDAPSRRSVQNLGWTFDQSSHAGTRHGAWWPKREGLIWRVYPLIITIFHALVPPPEGITETTGEVDIAHVSTLTVPMMQPSSLPGSEPLPRMGGPRLSVDGPPFLRVSLPKEIRWIIDQDRPVKRQIVPDKITSS